MVSRELLDNLLKRAMGYVQEERTIEYVIEEDGTKRATKERLSEKIYPPDMQALKLYLELKEECESLSSMTDEELEKERGRLLSELGKEGE